VKTALATFTALALFVAAGPVSVSRVEAAGPVIQVVEITGHRHRFDQPGVDAFVRYLLIDPANAELARDGFAPVAPRAVLMLFVGGAGDVGSSAHSTKRWIDEFRGAHALPLRRAGLRSGVGRRGIRLPGA